MVGAALSDAVAQLDQVANELADLEMLETRYPLAVWLAWTAPKPKTVGSPNNRASPTDLSEEAQLRIDERCIALDDRTSVERWEDSLGLSVGHGAGAWHGP